MSYRIRMYQKGDFEQVNTLWQKTGLGGKERGDDEGIILQTLAHGGRFFIMEEAETGFLIGTSWITNDARRLYLHHFGIKPDYQGNGYARALLAYILEVLKPLNMQLKLEVNKYNKRAVALYQKYGFQLLGDYDVYIIRDMQALE